jgi:hypothetical protein
MPAYKSKWIFSILRSCILDSRAAMLFPNNALYNKFTNQLITQNLYINDLSGNVHQGTDENLNEFFIEKRKQAQIIAPLISELVESILGRLFRGWANEIGIEIYDTLAIEILNSNPDTKEYSSGILEYANTLDITPSQAYQEIKLECDTYNSIKIRAYAVSKKYQALIRLVKTQEQADQLMAEIRQKLMHETRI